MLKAKFDIQDLTRSSDEVARLVSAQEVFSWLNGAINVPASWLAVAGRHALDPVLCLSSERLESEDVRDVLFVRTTGFACSLQHESLQSTDGFPCLGRISLSLRVLPEISELQVFRKTFLSDIASVSRAGIERHLQTPLRAVLKDLTLRHSAAELLAGVELTEIRELVDRACGPCCLTAGLALDGPAQVSFESPAWQTHQRQQLEISQQKQRAEARTQIQEAVAAAQRQHLDHLLGIIRGLRDAGGDRFDLPALLTGFSDAERGQLYGALWHLAPEGATQFAAFVSGQELLLAEPPSQAKAVRRLSLPDTLGLLRSVSLCKPTEEASACLLVGAHRGVHLVNHVPRVLRSWQVAPESAAGVRGGFNAAVITETHVLATHSELGLMAWRLADDDAVPGRSLLRELTRRASTVRCALLTADMFWFSADATLFAIPLDRLETADPIPYRCGSATVSAICADGGRIYVGDAAGTILSFESGDPHSMQIVRNATGQPIESLDLVTTSGVPRLIIADRSTGLTALVLGDQYTRRYEAGPMIVRRAAAAPDLFVAMNDARDRVLMWDPRRADAPVSTLIIPHLTGSTVQDVTLVPARNAS